MTDADNSLDVDRDLGDGGKLFVSGVDDVERRRCDTPKYRGRGGNVGGFCCEKPWLGRSNEPGSSEIKAFCVRTRIFCSLSKNSSLLSNDRDVNWGHEGSYC